MVDLVVVPPNSPTYKGLVKVIKSRGGRVFVVGDIHGDYELFMEKLVEVDFDREVDLVISVGDLVDRNCANEQVAKLLEEDWFEAVLGNHEEFCIVGNYDKHIEDIHSNPRNGGAWFYKLGQDTRDEIVEGFSKMPLAIEIEVDGQLYGFTHADFPFTEWGDLYKTDDPNIDVYGRSLKDWLIWSRFGYDTKDSETQFINGVRAVFHGHTPTRGKIEKRANCIYVDFGACFGYGMCLVELGRACDVVGVE